MMKYAEPAQYSTRANVFLLKYFNGEREIEVLEASPPLYPWNRHSGLCAISLVNPVLGEIPYSLLKAIRNSSLFVGLDVQGFIREVANGRISLSANEALFAILNHADLIHMDLEELYAITGVRDTGLALKSIGGRLERPIIAVTRGPKAPVIVYKGRASVIDEERPPYSEKTGSGDLFLGDLAYYIFIEGLDVEEAVILTRRDVDKWLEGRRFIAARSSC